MNDIFHQFLRIGYGLGVTLSLLFGSMVVGFFLGGLWAVLRHQKKGVFFLNGLVSVLRGTPLLLQLSIVYFAIPSMLGLTPPSVLTAGILTFGLNSGAYASEIFRSGIQSIPQGQFEACQTLHIPLFYMWKDIILPQVLRNAWPSLINEVIALLKETALISTIGGMDIMKCTKIVYSTEFTYFLPLTIAGCYYYGLVLIIERLGKIAERRLFLW